MSDTQHVPVAAVPYEVYRAQQAAADVTAAAALKLDQTVQGGLYLNAAGQKIDANGVPIKDEPKAAPETGLAALTVADLKALADDYKVELPASARKDEIVAALLAANIDREAE